MFWLGKKTTAWDRDKNSGLSRKAISVFLVLAVILFLFLPAVGEGGTLISAYPRLKNEYPAFFDKMRAELQSQGVAEGAVEGVIIAWLEDLDIKLREQLQQGLLTEGNFASKLFDICLQLASKHSQVTTSFIKILLVDYKIDFPDIQDIINGKKQLPPDFLPLYNAIKQEVLSDRGGSGGAPPPKTLETPGQVVPADGYTRISLDEVKRLLTQTNGSGGSGLVFEGQNGLELSSEVLALLKEKNSVVTFRGVEGKFIFQVSVKVVSVPSGAGLRITAREVPAGTAAGILAKLEDSYQTKSNVFEFDLENYVADTAAAPQTTALTGPVQLLISYANQSIGEADEEKLGVYAYNEKTASWEYAGGKVDKSTKTIGLMTSHLSKYALMIYDKTFADIQNHWAKNDIEVMAARHLARGTPGGVFQPERAVTRAEFAVMLGRVLGLSDASATVNFKDVLSDRWYFKDVAAAFRAGLVSGYDDLTFAPEDVITREQMAAMLVRALNRLGKAPVLADGEPQKILAAYRDKDSISNWAVPGAAAAVKAGLVKGRRVDNFAPQATATRAEGVALLKRLMQIGGLI